MRNILKILVTTIFVGVMIAILSTIYSGYDMYKVAISRISLEDKIEQIQKGDYVEIENVSEDFVNGIVSIEDSSFYNHRGINFISIGRATINNIKAKAFVEGGSTITQQLAKNLYFSMEKKLDRKIAELFVVYELETKYTKDEILEMYINVIYYGNGYVGINQASYGYFDKSPKDISFFQSVLLAGIPQAPSVYSLSENSDLAVNRGKEVVYSMVKNNYIDFKKAKEYIEMEGIDEIEWKKF